MLSTPPAFVLSQDQTLHKRAVSALALTDILVIYQQANNIHFDFMAQIIFLVHLRRDVKEIAIATSNLAKTGCHRKLLAYARN